MPQVVPINELRRGRGLLTTLVLCGLLSFPGLPAAAQLTGLPPETLSFLSMETFGGRTGGWDIFGAVRARHPGGPLEETAGTGVLHYDGSAPGVLLTELRHSDLEIDLEFMVEDTSCAALLLQSLYEISLCGSGSRVGRPESGRVLYGKATSVPPQLDAARASGTWQHVWLDFRAPRFDHSGRKTRNARLERAVLNGVTIHRAIEIPSPAANAPPNDESEVGLLAFQGGESAIAFRNVRYKQYEAEQVSVERIRFTYYESDGGDVGIPGEDDPAAAGSASELSPAPAVRNDNFTLRFEGVLDVPRTGAYYFSARSRGDLILAVDDGAIPLDGTMAPVELSEGDHPFVLTYSKSQRGAPALSVYVEGPQIRRHPITSAAGGWHPPIIAPIRVEPDTRPYILRNYVRHDGRKKVNGIYVGDPSGVHYSLDLDQAALLYVWRGPFLDLGPVWTGRGMEPDSRLLDEPEVLGSRLTFAGVPTVAFLGAADEAWPDTVDQSYMLEGYRLDDTGRPTFRYRLDGTEIQERFVPNGSRLAREITVTGDAGRTAWLRLAEGDRIEARDAGVFSVDDAFFVEVKANAEPDVRTMNGREELVMPVDLSDRPSVISFTLTW